LQGGAIEPVCSEQPRRGRHDPRAHIVLRGSRHYHLAGLRLPYGKDPRNREDSRRSSGRRGPSPGHPAPTTSRIVGNRGHRTANECATAGSECNRQELHRLTAATHEKGGAS